MKISKLYSLGLSGKEAEVFNFFLKNVNDGKEFEKKEIAEELEIGSNYLGQILAKLKEKRLISSTGIKPQKYYFSLEYLEDFYESIAKQNEMKLKTLKTRTTNQAILESLDLSAKHAEILKSMWYAKKQDRVTQGEIEYEGIPDWQVRRILTDLQGRGFLKAEKIMNKNYYSALGPQKSKNMHYRQLEKQFTT